MTYGIDGKCHNANHGTFNHECGRPAVWVGTKENGFRSGFCAECRSNGDERHGFKAWTPYADTGSLPSFPRFSATPTEDKLERHCEAMMNAADRRLLAGEVTQAQYDAWTRMLDNWSSAVRIVNPYYTAPRAHG